MMTTFSSLDRNDNLSKLKTASLDLLVIGGGITGAGISLDASQRGICTGLIEMQDFAAGTSSRSTKLIHGGLRYLKQFEIRMVAEVGKERAIVYENGPHITTPEWMMLPFYKGGTFGPFTTSIGLRVYDFLAGVKKEERRKMFSPSKAMEKEPLLAENGLKGAGYYVEYKTDDARLTIEVVKKAVELGALASNYVKAIEFIYEGSNVVGVKAGDQITGEVFPIYAKKVINATGPWVDHLREKDGSKEGKTLHITKGVHIIFPQDRFPLKQAIYFDSEDKRMIFAIPRGNITYVGTTDTDYNDDLEHPNITKDDYNYLLAATNYSFPSLHLTEEDIESSWSGLRPLIEDGGDKPGEISRKDEIFTSDSGLISMAGGKLTGYRKMAEDVVDIIVKQIKSDGDNLILHSQTKNLPISGGDVGGSTNFPYFKDEKIKEAEVIGIEHEMACLLVQRYGSNIDTVLDIYKENAAKTVEENIDPLVLAELVYSIKYEAAYKPEDFFIRRTGAMLFNIAWMNEHKIDVIRYMAKSLEWTEEQKENYTKELEQLLQKVKYPKH